MQIRFALAALLLTVVLSACGTAKTNLPPIPLHPAPQAEPVVNLPPYRIQLGDQLSVRFPFNPELNEDITVRPDGMISTAVSEDVMAYNQTPMAVASSLREHYKSTLKDPQLSVIVRSFAPNRIYVAGEVANPGEFITVGPNLTISQAIARAGGTKLSAARDKIFVIRRGPGDVPQAFKVDYMAVISAENPAQDARLAQYDVVYVPRTGVYEVYTFWNQFVQQFIPISWSFSYNANPEIRVSP